MRSSPRPSLGTSIAQMGKLKPRAGTSHSQMFSDSFHGAEDSGSPERTGLGSRRAHKDSPAALPPPGWSKSPSQKAEQQPCLSSGCLCAGEGSTASPAASASWALVTLAACLTPSHSLSSREGRRYYHPSSEVRTEPQADKGTCSDLNWEVDKLGFKPTSGTLPGLEASIDL